MRLRIPRLSLPRTARVVSLAATLIAAPAAAWAADDTVPWQLTQDRSGHTCPVTLRFDAAGQAGALAMPAGCRRALPILATVRTWAFDEDNAIQLRDDAGQSLLTFADQGGAWHADDGSGHRFTLTPPSHAAQAARQADATDPASQGPVALATPQIMTDADAAPPTAPDRLRLASAAAKPATAAPEPAAGRYAVMRGDRDTGCMVTLESSGKSSSRARLAPACRDQGITIFDPISWQMKGGQLMLTARKGHSIGLVRDENGTWVKMPKDVKALGLKPL